MAKRVNSAPATTPESAILTRFPELAGLRINGDGLGSFGHMRLKLSERANILAFGCQLAEFVRRPFGTAHFGHLWKQAIETSARHGIHEKDIPGISWQFILDRADVAQPADLDQLFGHRLHKAEEEISWFQFKCNGMNVRTKLIPSQC